MNLFIAVKSANLAGYHEFSEHFSIFRAHPLFFQFMVSLAFEVFDLIDTNARMISIIFAILTVYVTYLIGSNLFNKNVGLLSSFLLAILPYHIIVSRQAIVDVPYSFFFNLTLFFMIKYVAIIRNGQNNPGNLNLKNESLRLSKIRDLSFSKIRSLSFKDVIHNKIGAQIWIYALAVSSGLTFLSKEVGAIALISVLVYLRFRYKFGIINIIFVIGIFILTISPFLIVLTIREEASQNAFLYSQWQLSRPPNHPPSFYFDVLLSSLGFVLSGLCILAIIYGVISKYNRDTIILLLTWILIPFTFFQLWPTKGFYYMLPLIPAFVILGTSFLFTNLAKRIHITKKIIILIVVLIPLTTGAGILIFFPSGEHEYLAGSGGLPYAREAGQWIERTHPKDRF